MARLLLKASRCWRLVCKLDAIEPGTALSLGRDALQAPRPGPTGQPAKRAGHEADATLAMHGIDRLLDGAQALDGAFEVERNEVALQRRQLHAGDEVEAVA